VGNETHAKFIDLLRGAGTLTDAQADELRALDVDVDDAASIAVSRGWSNERAVAQCIANFERTPVAALTESTLDLRALAAFSEADAIDACVLPLVIDETTITLATRARPSEGDLRRWSERLGRKVADLRAIGCVLQKLLPYAYLARDHGAVSLRGRLASTDAPVVTTVRPANAAATVELAGVMNELGSAFSALRAFARAEPSKAAPAGPPARSGPLPSSSSPPSSPAGATPPLKSASSVQASAFQRTPTGSFAAPRVPGGGDSSSTSAFQRTPTGSFGAPRVAGAVDSSSTSALQRTPTGSFGAPRAAGAVDSSSTSALQRTPTGSFGAPTRTATGSMRGVGVTGGAMQPVVVGGVDRAPPSTRAAPPAVFVALADHSGAALAEALRRDGATVFEAVDVPRLRALLRSTKPAVVVVDADLPGDDAGSLAPTVVREVPGNDDVAVVVVAARELPTARFGALHGEADALVVFDGVAEPVALVRAALAPFLGKPVSLPARPAARAVDLGALRTSLAWVRAADENEAVLARLDAHLVDDPWDAEAHALRASVLLALKRANDALRAWERATTLDPGRGDTWTALATHLDRVGLARKAERAWRRAADVATDEAVRRRIAERLSR
jgi:CheY-like chemotaxis protein